MAGANCACSFSATVGEFLHQVPKVATSCCSTSSRSGTYGKTMRGGRLLCHQVDLLNQLAGSSIRRPQCRLSISTSCLIHGLWENSESEGKGNDKSTSRKSSLKEESSILLGLVREIPPLDINLISKEASPDSTDAMKRTISGMLGLLPSDEFNVTVETSREPLAKLLVSSMMTGYTLRNAEYRLCLRKSLYASEDDEGEVRQNRESASSEKIEHDGEKDIDLRGIQSERDRDAVISEMLLPASTTDQLPVEDFEGTASLGPMDDKVKQYIQALEHKLASDSKELEECKHINMGLQMQNIVSEEKNDLLDYLRSLEPDKVAELSQPSSPAVEGVIQQVINDLLDSPTTKIQYKGTQVGKDATTNVNGFSLQWTEGGAQKCSASPLHFQSTVIISRDYLARLLFWCMLMGHHMRGLEYRIELSRTLSLSGDL